MEDMKESCVKGWSIEKVNKALSPEERTESARKAGYARGKQAKEDKMLRNATKRLLKMGCSIPEVAEELSKIGLDNATNADAVTYGQIVKAVVGKDTDAARYLRDTSGEKPRESLDVAQKPLQAKDMSDVTDSDLAAIADD